MSAETVMPGDELATSEEFMPGPGTYERDGRIYAAVTGVKNLAEGEMTVGVIPFRSPPVLKPGDMVLGEVTGVSNALMSVSVTFFYEGGSWRWVRGDGALHVSKASKGFDDDLRKLFRPGDLIRARVIQSRPSLQLSTEGEEFGVIRARCPRCRGPMPRAGRELRCPECDWKERRRLASDYDDFNPAGESNKK
jgi:exosome complex component CSL4